MHYIDLCAGEWAVAEQAIVSNKNLSKLGFDIHLDACVFLNPGTSAVSDKTMSTTMAALIGAVFCDGGGDALGKLLETLKLDHENLRSVMSKSIFFFRGAGATHAVWANHVFRPHMRAFCVDLVGFKVWPP